MSLYFKHVRVFDGERFLPGPRDVLVDGERIASIDETLDRPAGARLIDGGVLLPGFVDAHVHLSFSDPRAVAGGGVTTVLDLGAPPEYAAAPHPPVTFRTSGPIITAPGGYPTLTWGEHGYGVEVAGPGDARDVVGRLAGRGAAIIKVALEPRGGPTLGEASLAAAIEAAGGLGLRVAAHALEAPAVELAVSSGVAVLAHTPIGKLSDDLVGRAAAAGVAVISTMRAFGASRTAKKNLARLAAAGCRVVYGTDLGNGAIKPGIDLDELDLIADATGSTQTALVAATSAAGTVAGYGGRIRPGVRADLVWVPAFRDLDGLEERRVVVSGRPASEE